MSGLNSLVPRQIFIFGPFTLKMPERVLERAGKPVAISEKTFDVLYALVENRGRLVEKETLMRTAWPETFVEDSNIAFQISTLRKVLDDSATSPQIIATVPKRGYRIIPEIIEQPVAPPPADDTPAAAPPKATPPATPLLRQNPPVRRSTLAILAVIVLTGLGGAFITTRTPKQPLSLLTDKGTIVLANFENKTGDPVFDGTLRQGLLVDLGQSPRLSLLSEQRVQRTLRLMQLPPATTLTRDIALNVCKRTGSTVLMEGSIERIGSLYVLGLKATDCANGSLIDAEQAKSETKERVLDALGAMASVFRARVGESVASLKQHNAPLAEATTASEEALQAYTMAWTLHTTHGAADAIPLLRHAVELDPDFVLAHAALGRMYADIDESDLSSQSLQRAWELRQRASDRERFFITTNHLILTTGNMEEARNVAEAWILTYPRDSVPHTLLSGLPSKVMGRFEEAISQARKALELDPDYGYSYLNLALNNQFLQRFDAATAALETAAKRGIDLEEFQMVAYDLAFLRHDTERLAQIVAGARRRPSAVSWIANKEAFRLAYLGRLRDARSITEQAIAQAEASNQTERAALWAAGEAVRDAMAGNQSEAITNATRALRLSRDREVSYGAAVAFASAGDPAKAQAIVDELAHKFPDDTSVRFVYLPVIQAQIALDRHQPQVALEVLNGSKAFEMGMSRCPLNSSYGALYPVYFRGLALIAAGRGAEAAAEFQKILDHSGEVVTDPSGAFAPLQLARAYRTAGYRTKATMAYEHFLQSWKDADADIPILQAAKAEYSQTAGKWLH